MHCVCFDGEICTGKGRIDFFVQFFPPSNFVLVQLAMADIILFDKNVEEVNGASYWILRALVFYFGLWQFSETLPFLVYMWVSSG